MTEREWLEGLRPEDITWTCHVCGRERPDEAISVYTMEVSAAFNLPPGTVQQNVRYCNDNPGCIAGALYVRFTPDRDS